MSATEGDQTPAGSERPVERPTERPAERPSERLRRAPQSDVIDRRLERRPVRRLDPSVVAKIAAGR